MKYTTIKDLYEWAVENNELDLPIDYQFGWWRGLLWEYIRRRYR